MSSLNSHPAAQKTAAQKGLGFGLGLRHPHMEQVLAGQSRVDWFEIISENYMDSAGRSLQDLKRIAERYPVAFHGVSMSIGSTDPFNYDYLQRLKKLAETIEPCWISDHLCWTGVAGLNSHDLLPLPLNEASLSHVSERVQRVQDYLGRQLVLENPSTYMSFKDSDIDEPDYLTELVAKTGCGLLLDVNNVFVTCFNAGKKPETYLQRFPFESVVQIHLAGHEDCGHYLIDTHDKPVRAEVWELFAQVWQKLDGASVSLEWDNDIPPLAACEDELFKARDYIEQLPGSPLSDAREQQLDRTEKNKTVVSTPVDFLVPDMMKTVENG